MKLLSGSKILMTITCKLRIILQNIGRRVVGSIVGNISYSIIIPIMLFPEIFHQNCQAAFGHCGH